MKFKKNLKLLDVFSMTTIAMLPGLFVLPGLAYELAGPAVLLSYLLAALLAVIGLLSQAELTSAMPKAGGTYFYVTRSMGSAVGTVYGLVTWLAIVLKTSFELLFVVVVVVAAFKVNMYASAVLLCGLLVVVNLVGEFDKIGPKLTDFGRVVDPLGSLQIAQLSYLAFQISQRLFKI